MTFIANELPVNITLESNQKIGKFGVCGVFRVLVLLFYRLTPHLVFVVVLVDEIETKAAALKREMEERELNVIQLQREVKEAAEIACRGKLYRTIVLRSKRKQNASVALTIVCSSGYFLDHDELQNGIFDLKKMLTEMQRKVCLRRSAIFAS